jgi:hypothetical protein
MEYIQNSKNISGTNDYKIEYLVLMCLHSPIYLFFNSTQMQMCMALLKDNQYENTNHGVF